jgi:hypothetical protein
VQDTGNWLEGSHAGRRERYTKEEISHRLTFIQILLRRFTVHQACTRVRLSSSQNDHITWFNGLCTKTH